MDATTNCIRCLEARATLLNSVCIDCLAAEVGWKTAQVAERDAEIARLEAVVTSAKELRDALAGAIRVIVNSGVTAVADSFNAEMRRMGIEPGIGVRADEAIKNVI